MSDHLCPHCSGEFSNEQEARFREEVTRQNKLRDLRNQFRKDSSWEVWYARWFRNYLLALCICGVLWVSALTTLAVNTASSQIIFVVFAVGFVSMLAVLVIYAAYYHVSNKKEASEFQKWRIERGV